jgi:RNA polymerase-binding protein DksA
MTPTRRSAPTTAVTDPPAAKRPARTRSGPSADGQHSSTRPAARASRTAQSARAAAGSGALAEWTAEELAQARADLLAEVTDMGLEYDRSIADLEEIQASGGSGAGDDQADTGAATFEREQELSIAANRRDLIDQMQRAIQRIDSGTYGLCERCGNTIPKARLQAFPAATLDVACKQREERR